MRTFEGFLRTIFENIGGFLRTIFESIGGLLLREHSTTIFEYIEEGF